MNDTPMNKIIRAAGVIAKPNREVICEVVTELISWLHARGIRMIVERETAECAGLTAPGVPLAEMAGGLDSDKLDLAIVLGGDGTMLAASRVLGPKQVPILGVNLGSLGFLTSVALDELYPQLELILQGQHQTNTRMMLEASIVRHDGREGWLDGQIIESQHAMNDAVVNQAALARLMDFDVHVDGSHIGRYRADGLIVSTPTGSTAYSLAAGGPIVHPALDAFVITPICPHMLTNRPIVIPDTATVDIAFPHDAETPDPPLQLTLDGQIGFALQRGDRVTIRKSGGRVILVSPRERTYYEMLRDKLRWGER